MGAGGLPIMVAGILTFLIGFDGVRRGDDAGLVAMIVGAVFAICGVAVWAQ